MSLAMLRVARYRLRATFRQRRGGYLAVIILVGLVGGLAIGAVAGARRTQSSFSVYLASTNPSSLLAFTGFDNPALGLTHGYEPAIAAEVARLPGVRGAAFAAGFDGNLGTVKGVRLRVPPGGKPPVVEGSLGTEYLTQDRVTLAQGQLADPSRIGEAVMDAQAATELGVRVGSAIQLSFYSDAQETRPNPGRPYLTATVRITGIVVFSQDVVQDQIDALGSARILLTPALTRELAVCCATYSYAALRVAGGPAQVPKVAAEVRQLVPRLFAAIGASRVSSIAAKADQVIRPEAVALAVFGALAGLAALLIAGQIVSRQLRVTAADLGTLRALGAGPAMTTADGFAGAGIAVILGSLLSVSVAVGLSALTPLGPVRAVYPTPGVAFDWTVLGLGCLLLVLVLVAASLLVSYRQAPHLVTARLRRSGRRPSGAARAAAVSGLPAPAVTGIRFALEPGAGEEAVPVRSAIIGAALAVLVVVATITFGSSLNSLVSHPPLYGWNWNYALLSGFAGDEDLPAHQSAVLLKHDPEVAAASGVYFGDGMQIGTLADVRILGASPNAAVAPPVLSGHGLQAPNQIVLAPATLAALREHLGDTVTVGKGAVRPVRLVIVGTATMPTIGGLEMGSGAVVDYRLIPASVRNAQQSATPGPNAFLIRTRTSQDSTAALRSLQAISRRLNLTNSDQPAGGVVSVLRPAEILNTGATEVIPAILGAGLSAGAAAALGLVLVASVRRRRRELAVLKALGFSRRQLAAVIAWQSSIAVAIGAVAGVPLGIVVGRVLWDLFAREINAVPAPSVPVLTIGVISAGALLAANLVAGLPGRIAGRTPMSVLLRME